MRQRMSLWVMTAVLEVLLVLGATKGYAQKNASIEASSVLSPSDGTMLVVGEELHYNVSYSFFHLGRIIIRVLDRFERDGTVVYKAAAIIDSAPGLPFVNMHIRFYGEFDRDLYSYSWVAEDSSSGGTSIRKLEFQYDSARVLFTTGKRTTEGVFTTEKTDTVKITAKCQDGLSLFFYARKHAGEHGELNVATVIEKQQVNTFFNLKHEIDDEEIDSVRYPIEVVEFEGRADFVGIFGLTGGFRGRFSNDGASVPIVARMNVILGSIKVTLDQWKRPGWIPPRFVEKD